MADPIEEDHVHEAPEDLTLPCYKKSFKLALVEPLEGLVKDDLRELSECYCHFGHTKPPPRRYLPLASSNVWSNVTKGDRRLRMPPALLSLH